MPAPQTCTNGAQNSEAGDQDLDPKADEVDSFEQYIDNLFAASKALKCKGRKTTEFWDVKTIESDGTFKQLHLSVKEAMKPPNNKKIVLRFNKRLQPVENEAGEKCRKNAVNRSKQLYTHTGGSKSLARFEEEEEKIVEIEQHDESSRLLSQNDSLAQTLGKEHPGRVRGMGIGPTSSQVFSTNSHQPSNGTQREETQRVLLELQAELAAEKLERKAMEDEAALEKTKRQAMKSALKCLIQG
ncbi:hypothetical protein Ahy_B06g084206 [Arachis hypogaea]|uniref:Uncharacterized protein n=1 Tax=Arachis hypogaea TaxID=3818 RepID=A0A444YRD1_ARAHY|nr:hypothetical protein Ahy_B06g084206 [Arachis hypogaea]